MSTTLTLLPALARWVTTPREKRSPSQQKNDLHESQYHSKASEKLTLNLGIETLDIVISARTLARHNLRHHHRRPRPLSSHNVYQLPQAFVRRLPTVGVAIVGSGMQEDGVGGSADAVDGTGDLVDRPAGVAFVVFVGQSAAAHAADVVYFGAGGGEGGEEGGAVGVAGGGADAVLGGWLVAFLGGGFERGGFDRLVCWIDR